MADFEQKLATVYTWDQDETWNKAHNEAEKVVRESQEIIAKRCEELGIPKTFAPSIGMSWHFRTSFANGSPATIRGVENAG